jgi:hypothetical protein
MDCSRIAAAAASSALIAFSNAWNLRRFVVAQTRPEFRIKEYD